MWPRLTGREFDARSGAGTHDLLQDLVADGGEPGLVAFHDDEPVGWVAVAPRHEYGRVLRSPLLRPYLADDGRGSRDDAGVWAVVCFFIHREWRSVGLAHVLAAAACDQAWAHDAHTVEGYAIESVETGRPDELFHGTPGTFARAGFSLVAELSERRSLWRHEVGAPSGRPQHRGAGG
jgi:GNAT superfamily N-acetyltransferase